MDLDYQIVVNQQGQPEKVVLSWEDFQKLQPLLQALGSHKPSPEAPSIPPAPAPADAPAAQDTEEESGLGTAAEYKEGGDYKPLSKIGINLPEKIKHRTYAVDPTLPSPEDAPDNTHKIRLGKRIR